MKLQRERLGRTAGVGKKSGLDFGALPLERGAQCLRGARRVRRYSLLARAGVTLATGRAECEGNAEDTADTDALALVKRRMDSIGRLRFGSSRVHQVDACRYYACHLPATGATHEAGCVGRESDRLAPKPWLRLVVTLPRHDGK